MVEHHHSIHHHYSIIFIIIIIILCRTLVQIRTHAQKVFKKIGLKKDRDAAAGTYLLRDMWLCLIKDRIVI